MFWQPWSAICECIFDVLAHAPFCESIFDGSLGVPVCECIFDVLELAPLCECIFDVLAALGRHFVNACLVCWRLECRVCEELSETCPADE